MGMNCKIIDEDESILVCLKPAGLAVQSGRVGEADMVSELKNYLSAGNPDPYLGLVHRLDQPVSGLMVFGKTVQAAAGLSRQAARREDGETPKGVAQTMRGREHTSTEGGKKRNGSGEHGKSTPPSLEKEYSALLYPEDGRGLPEEGTRLVLENYLIRDGRQNRSRVASKDEKGAKWAKLEMEILKHSSQGYALARIRLITGRHHQIRVQCAASGLPLLGDARYGSPSGREYAARLGFSSVCLCASGLCFSHPVTGKRMEYRMEELPWKI